MAQIYFGIDNLSVPVGETFEVGVFLDGHSQSIAAVQSLVTFPDGLKLVDILDGDSVLNLWLERPQGNGSVVSFSGLVPNGYTGDKGHIFTLVLQAQATGEMTVETQETKILLNDGLGTPAEVIVAPISITVVSEGDPVNYETPIDLAPPEPFTPMLVDLAQSGQWSVAFAAQDKGSGIDYFEVREGLFGWQRTESPHLLSDQELQSSIYVRAVDGSGNERVIKLPPTNPLPWYDGYVFWSILALVLVATGILVASRRLWQQGFKRRVRK